MTYIVSLSRYFRLCVFYVQLWLCSTFFPYTTLFRSHRSGHHLGPALRGHRNSVLGGLGGPAPPGTRRRHQGRADRKSTRLNSSHVAISYAVFCLKQKNCLQS